MRRWFSLFAVLFLTFAAFAANRPIGVFDSGIGISFPACRLALDLSLDL